MAGFSTTNTQYVIRTDIWSNDIKRVFEDELMGWKYVKMLNHPDGETIHMPSFGSMSHRDYAEGQQLIYDAFDTGNFEFDITEYKSAATYITNKMKQDSFYTSQLMAAFVPEMNRALAYAMEIDILKTPTPAGTAGQTTASTNSINGAEHRWVGLGTSETMTVKDFQKARYALQKANVPQRNLIAIVDPSVEYALATQTNLVNLTTPMPTWGGVLKTGLATGMRFITNIYGFEVYVSNNLHVNTASETIGSATAAAGVNNLFFSADSGALPIVGAIRQAPKVESKYNMDWQREEFAVTCRYGLKTFRPENMVIVVTDTDQVA